MGFCNKGLGSYQKWFIGNDLRTILLRNEDVRTQVGEKIFPLVAPENTNGDFIIYLREKYAKSSVKMGVYEDMCEVAVVGISDNYDSAIALASKIDNALTGLHTLDNGVQISVMLADSTESYDDEKYIETLLFRIK